VNQRIFNGLLGILFFVCACPYALATQVVVVFSSSNPSQQQNFSDTLRGIENKHKTLLKLEIAPGASDLQAQLDVHHPDRVIALGRAAAELVNKTTYKTSLLAGLFSFEAKDFNGVSLSLDNTTVAAKLTQLIPSIGRLFFVQQQGFQTIKESLIKNDKTSKIKMLNGGDSLTTIRSLSKLLEFEVNSSDAVFIPPNLPDDILFKIGLTAWDKNIKLFSTNLWHLENGAMIVFYPNAVAMGEQLARMVDKKLPAYETVDTMSFALNRRLAQHNGVDFDTSAQEQFSVKIK
jgi:hypothetical protein